IELRAHGRQIRGPARHPYFDQGAAGEIDAVIEAGRQEYRDRRDRQQPGQKEAEQVPSHEVDLRHPPNDNERSHYRGIAFGLRRRSQVTICSRVTRIAENSEVKTPMLRVTAKPFTGPEPSEKSRMPATKVVTWLSRIVPKA